MKRIFWIIVWLALSTAAVAQHGIMLGNGSGGGWTLSTTPGITSQLVCRSTSTGTENCAVPLTTIANNTTASYLDTTGVAGTKYFYVLEACIGAICSVPSVEASAVFPTVPTAPTGLGAVPQ